MCTAVPFHFMRCVFFSLPTKTVGTNGPMASRGYGNTNWGSFAFPWAFFLKARLYTVPRLLFHVAPCLLGADFMCLIFLAFKLCSTVQESFGSNLPQKWIFCQRHGATCRRRDDQRRTDELTAWCVVYLRLLSPHFGRTAAPNRTLCPSVKRLQVNVVLFVC